MKSTSQTEKTSAFALISEGLNDSIAQARGELTLRTTTLPAAPPPAKAATVVRLRKRMKMSQAVFARYLNVSTKTIQSWEQGSRTPKAGELRLLQLVELEPAQFERAVSSAKVSKRGGSTKRAQRTATSRGAAKTAW